jgi:hypothetical protein
MCCAPARAAATGVCGRAGVHSAGGGAASAVSLIVRTDGCAQRGSSYRGGRGNLCCNQSSTGVLPSGLLCPRVPRGGRAGACGVPLDLRGSWFRLLCLTGC